MMNGQLGEAEALLLPLTQSSKNGVLMKAAYNMYILCEARGRMDEAQEWLLKYQFYQNRTQQE